MRAGEVLVMESAGGGWGDPLDRAPAAVADDVVQGYLTADAQSDATESSWRRPARPPSKTRSPHPVPVAGL
jgi:N-methylhydantoinase B/oxoprolinase/acetone carboxylase alpha subunit